MLGDLLFIEPIIRMYSKEQEVIWPIKDQYYWLKDYIPYVNIVKESEYGLDHEYCGFKDIDQDEYIPLRFATALIRDTDPHDGVNHQHFMLDKYRLLGLPLDMWRTLTWERNIVKEDKLYTELGLQEDSTYILVNYYMKDVYERQEEMVNTDYGTNVIYMKPTDGYTLLDWTKVIINASKIYTVETALLYMVEVLPIKATEIHMFSRSPWQDTLVGVKNFISDRWIKHEKW